VSHPVAVNIDFCGYLRLFLSVFSEEHALQYDTENLSGQQLVLVSLTSVDIQHTLGSSASDKQTHTIWNLIRWVR